MNNLTKLFKILEYRDYFQLIILFILVLVMAIIEMMGLASILPFMAVLSKPEIIESNKYLNQLFQFSKNFGIKDIQGFTFFLGSIFFILYIISLSLKAFISYYQVSFFSYCQFNLARKFISGYLSKPYYWFFNRNTSDIGKNIISEIGIVIGGGLSPIVNFVVQVTLSSSIMILLIIMNPKIAFTIVFFFSCAYFLIYRSIINYVRNISNKRFDANKWRFSAVSEAFGAIKEIKFAGIEQTYIDRFSTPAKNLASYQASFSIVNKLPKIIIEAFAFGGTTLLLLFLISKKGSLNEVIPLITLYVLAAYKLIPSLQSIYSNKIQFDAVSPAIQNLYKDFINFHDLKYLKNKTKNRLIFKKSINLKNIYYKYPGALNYALNNIEIKIKPKSIIGIVGQTGSGKTTLVDILLGLLRPTKGKIIIDNKIIDKLNFRKWQNSLGYVPQTIYLSDGTIAENIAFGENIDDIDKKRIENAAKIAEIHDFIIKNLPQNYQTKVGQNGIKLSGGQRQRIGIARALYRNPELLIMDEATNALDVITENKIINSIFKMKKNKTVIFITHRINITKNCDEIFIIKKGNVVDSGNYSKLIKKNKNFRLASI